jgi:hypothetical protein
MIWIAVIIAVIIAFILTGLYLAYAVAHVEQARRELETLFAAAANGFGDLRAAIDRVRDRLRAWRGKWLSDQHFHFWEGALGILLLLGLLVALALEYRFTAMTADSLMPAEDVASLDPAVDGDVARPPAGFLASVGQRLPKSWSERWALGLLLAMVVTGLLLKLTVRLLPFSRLDQHHRDEDRLVRGSSKVWTVLLTLVAVALVMTAGLMAAWRTRELSAQGTALVPAGAMTAEFTSLSGASPVALSMVAPASAEGGGTDLWTAIKPWLMGIAAAALALVIEFLGLSIVWALMLVVSLGVLVAEGGIWLTRLPFDRAEWFIGSLLYTLALNTFNAVIGGIQSLTRWRGVNAVGNQGQDEGQPQNGGEPPEVPEGQPGEPEAAGGTAANADADSAPENPRRADEEAEVHNPLDTRTDILL